MSIDYLAFSSIRYLATYSFIFVISLMQVVYYNACDLPIDCRCHGRLMPFQRSWITTETSRGCDCLAYHGISFYKVG